MHDHISLERIIPDLLDGHDIFDQATLKLHIERYRFAIQNGRPGDVLDIACGAGYGSDLIVNTGKYAQSRIVAVDIDDQAISYARKRYGNPAIEFICSDAILFTSAKKFDTIISLETIEHLKDPVAFIKKLGSLIKENGLLIISAPITPSTDGNPHHLSDFSRAGFKRLFEINGWTILNQFIQVQPFSAEKLLISRNNRLIKRRQDIGKYYFRHPGVLFLRIRSLLVDGFNNKYMTLVLRKS